MKRAGRRQQSGAMALLIIAFFLMGGLLLAYTAWNVAAVRVDRDRSTNTALAKAKDALIAFAVGHISDVPVVGAPTRPGQLPCPDVNDDGVQDSDATGACTSLIGRLPWITLGLPDLRDDSAERLWYAVSNDFRTDYTVPPAVPLNSDTAYRAGNASLTVNGSAPAASLAALVISPGGTLTRSDGRVQSRGCTTACDPRDFLDIDSAEDNADGNMLFVAATRSATFNDTLMPVFAEDIMRLVERRAARELAMHLRNHYDMWQGALVNNTKGFYPFAATFNDPSTPQLGANGNPAGLLPLANTPLTWTNASAGCSGVGTQTIDCTVLVVCVVVCLTTVSAQIDNIATRFVDPPALGNVNVLLGLALGGSPTWTLNSGARRLDFSYSGFIAAGVFQVQVTAPGVSTWLGNSWLMRNNWHQVTGYALSTGHSIDGSETCGGAAPPCITILNTGAPNNNKHAVVMTAGRALPSQPARPIAPPATPDQFFEGLNPDPTYTELEANLRTDTFNDTPVVVRP